MKTYVRYTNLELKLEEKKEDKYLNQLLDARNQLIKDVSWGSGKSNFRGVKTLVNQKTPWSKYKPKAALLSESDPRSFEVTFPDNFFNFETEGVNHFIGTVAGDVLLNRQIESLKVEDFSFEKPNNYFPGPNFGIDGVYELFDVKDRPLLAYSIKPRMGYDIALFEKILSAAVRGGADIVEDDERMIDPVYCPFEERVKKAKEIQKEGKTYYSANITGPLDKMIERVNIAHNNGIKFVKVDVLVTGFDALREITLFIRKNRFDTRITVYPDVIGLYRNLSRHFILKMSRLCGADIIYAGSPSWSRNGDYSNNLIFECNKVNMRHEMLKNAINNMESIKATMATMTNDISAQRAEVITHIFHQCFSNTQFAFFIGSGISSSDNVTAEIKDIITRIKNAAKASSYTYVIGPSRNSINSEEDLSDLDLEEMIKNYKGL